MEANSARPEPGPSPLSPARALVPSTALDIQTIGAIMVRSGFFSDTKDEAQAIVKILYGQELGVPPVQAMMGVHIIQGKPAPSAGLLAALIKRSGRYTYQVRRLDNEGCELRFFERQGGKWDEVGASSFSRADADAAGAFTGKNVHTWNAYARNMFFARALSNGARWYCADIFGGPVYTPEELGAAVDEDGNAVIDVSPDPSTPGGRQTAAPAAAEPGAQLRSERPNGGPASAGIDPGSLRVSAHDPLYVGPDGMKAWVRIAKAKGLDVPAVAAELGIPDHTNISEWTAREVRTLTDELRERCGAPEPEIGPDGVTEQVIGGAP